MPEKYQRAKEIFEEVCDAAPGERTALLERACGDDSVVRDHVEHLLAGDARPTGFLDSPGGRGVFPFEALSGDAAESDTLPEMIGPYRILRRIGEGGMGVVFEAEQPGLGRRVALKIVRPGLFSPQMLKRLEREAKILGRLRHPGIEQVYEAGFAQLDHGRVPYFAAEIIDGLPLTAYAREQGLDIRGKLLLLIKVCEAVQYAHQNRVIHRDLKPGNILVAGDGQPKILDFGVARVLDADASQVSMATVSGQLVGTLPYMSPEQVAGDPQSVDTRSDVYALGVIAYELLAGQLPLDLKDTPLVEAARRIREQQPPRLSSVHGALRGDLETIVGKALAKEPDQRYQSVSQLQEDLERYLSGQPVLARAPSAAYHLRKLVARHKLPAALLAGLFVLALGSGVGMTVLYFEQRAATRQAEAIAEQLKEQVAHSTYLADNAERVADFFQQLVNTRPDPAWASAHEHFLDAIAKRVDKRLGEHPHAAARTPLSLGWAYYSRGRYQDTVEQMRASLRIWKDAHGANDVWTITAQAALATSLVATGANDEALRVAKDAVDASASLPVECWRAQGDAASAAGLVANLAGDYAAAERFLRQADDIFRQNLPVASSTRRGVVVQLSQTLCYRQDYTGAEELARESLAMAETKPNPNNLELGMCRFSLGWSLTGLGRFEEAEAELLAAHECLAQLPGGEQDHGRPVVEKLIELYEAWGKVEQAAIWRAKLPDAPGAPTGGSDGAG